VDTTILMVLAFGGQLSGSVIVRLIFSGYLFKVIYEALATPVTYAVVAFLKRAEGIDTFDYETRFTPFSTEL
jgi:uncharacterized PurR-regulated membrane protein YhhQ (DUF165 family)